MRTEAKNLVFYVDTSKIVRCLVRPKFSVISRVRGQKKFRAGHELKHNHCGSE